MRRLWSALMRWVRSNDRLVAAVTLGLTAFGAFDVYYYNRLTVLEYNVEYAQANLEASELQRGHVEQSLSRLLRHYGKYESGVMENVTHVRADGERRTHHAAPADDASGLLGRLQMVAEQYPSLHLVDTTKMLGDAVVTSEKDVNDRIVRYNAAVNQYTTVLNKFPGNLVGPALGFRSFDYYVPPRHSVTSYRELDL